MDEMEEYKVSDWRLKDYELRCENLQNKIEPFSVKRGAMKRAVKIIKQEQECDDLTAWRILKQRLEKQLQELKGVTDSDGI